jgi:hypothetical protein
MDLSLLRPEQLTHATDRLLLRPRHPIWQRSRGTWQLLETGPLPRPDYETVRADLLARSHAVDPAAENGWPRRLPLPNGITLGIESISTPDGELLQLRAIELPAPDPTVLDGDRRTLESTLGQDDALIFAASDDAAVARRLLHALIAWRIASGPEPVLLIGDEGTYRHAPAATPVVRPRTGEIARLLTSFERATVAIDPALGCDPPRAASLIGAGLILAGATGPDPARAVSRWLLALAGNEPAARASLSGRDLLVAWGEGDADDERSLPFRLWTPAARERAQLVTGETVSQDPDGTGKPGSPRLKVVRPQA